MRAILFATVALVGLLGSQNPLSLAADASTPFRTASEATGVDNGRLV